MNYAGPRRRGGHPQKWHLTPEKRELLVALYDGCNRQSLAQRLGVPVWTVSKWAGELGIRRTKEPRWTQSDLDYLEENISRSSWAALSRKLRRSKVAIKLMAKRLGLRKLWTEGMTKRQVAQAFGVDDHKVSRWIGDGWLRARRRGTDRVSNGDVWLIRAEDLRRFVALHPEQIDLRRVADKQWFIDMLVGELEPESLAEGRAA